jgi:hypothetical protein
MMDPKRLAEIKARLTVAAPGPWSTREDEDYYQGGTYIGHGPEHYEANERVPGLRADGTAEYFAIDVCRVHHEPSADLLIHAPEDLLDLLAEVERLRALMAEEGHDDLCPRVQGVATVCFCLDRRDA